MELVLILLALWILATVNIGLVWHIHNLDENMYWERKESQENIARILADSESERKNLYDRLMAGTLQQFKEHEQISPNETEVVEEEFLPLDEVREELENA